MANIGGIYDDLGQLWKLADAVNDANWDASADLAEQANRLEEIAELATANMALLRAADKALG